jgi:type IV secretory pathway VirB2 component (pilin)
MPDFGPADSTALTGAIVRMQGSLLGSVATLIAVIAVASTDLLMLTGRISVPRAAQVIFGCFIIFGASTIANGIIAALHGTPADPELARAATPPPPQLPPPIDYPKAPRTPYDPYAGAALPSR